MGIIFTDALWPGYTMALIISEPLFYDTYTTPTTYSKSRAYCTTMRMRSECNAFVSQPTANSTPLHTHTPTHLALNNL